MNRVRSLSLAVLLAHAASAAPAAERAVPAARPPSPGACALLSDEVLQKVQGQPPVQRLQSEQKARGFKLQQCFFRAADFARSVSLSVAVAQVPGPDGPREFWTGRFREEEAEGKPSGEHERPPQRVSGVGEEAFWVGDARTGSLYVLQGDTFVRLSLGGAGDLPARILRAKALAAHALAASPRRQASRR